MHMEQLLASSGDGSQDDIVMTDTYFVRKVRPLSVRFGDCRPVTVLFEKPRVNHLPIAVTHERLDSGKLSRLESCPCLWFRQMLGAGI